ncbi:MAG: Glycosyl transferase group 1 [uncultured bacterium]|nr:MAG: Glycosyl transferase group 1 [uncultured bacterium]
MYPGFDLRYWAKIKSQITNNKSQINFKFYLIVSRLESYKRIDLAIQLFNQLKCKLVIVGEGSEEKRLTKTAGNNIIFLSKLSDNELGRLYASAQALIMPQEEDFGYVALEAQFFDCPVISYKNGGTVETIKDKKTGVFFDKQTVRSLRHAIERFEKIKYNLRVNISKFGLRNIDRFNIEIFQKKLIKFIGIINHK